jgi:tetratricopeptide (TPR) repeat protein
MFIIDSGIPLSVISSQLSSRFTLLGIYCKLFLLSASLGYCCPLFAQTANSATVKEYRKIFPTYPFSDPSPIPLFSAVYPYFRYDGFTDKPVAKEWMVVELENAYIKLLILPEIGGKIWAAIEKSTGRPFLYYNHTVKFRDVAMRGPWTSGGLEANYGIFGHTPNCATPVDYLTRTNSDGSVSCIIGALDLLTRSNWRIEINLAPDKAYFTTQSFWYNGTPLEQPYYHWMNAGIKARGNLEFIYPGNRYLGHEGEFADWPINRGNGKNISFYEANDFGGYKSYHVFGKYSHFFGAYWHDDDFGMARYASHDDKLGKKIWIWGLSGQGMIWEKLLSDTDGQYVEVQSGRLFNQNAAGSSFTPFKHRSMAPYASDSWKEYWYPVLQTKGFVEANEYGAFNIRYEHGWLKCWFSPVQAINDTLVITQDGRTVFSRTLNLSPMQPFADSIRLELDPQKLVATLGGNKLVYRADPNADLIGRPVESPADFDWNSAYGLYLQGKESMDMKDYPRAEEKLLAALQKEPDFQPALVKLSELFCRNMRYAEALVLARKALSIDTHAGDANYYYGLINVRLGNITDAKDGLDAATLAPDYRSAAYTELARIWLKEKSLEKSLVFAGKAVDYDRYNMDALQLEALVLRKLKDPVRAAQVLETLLSYDPMNHFARFEQWLWDPTSANRSAFGKMIRNEMPQETYLELGTWYYEAGAPEEALSIFHQCPPTPEAACWIGYLEHSPVDCAAIDPALAFPSRWETAAVLEQLRQSQHGAADWFLKYQLALIYKDRNRVAESRKLFADCGNDPGYAPFYATRSEIFLDSDSTQALADLQKALSLDRNQWRYHKMLAEYYIEHREYGKAVDAVKDFYVSHPGNYIIGLLCVRAQLLNNQAAEAARLLSHLSIIPFEGATAGHELFREAMLMQAVHNIEKKDFNRSLAFIAEAETWPERLGSGKPYDEDIDSRVEDWMKYLCYWKLGRADSALATLRNIETAGARFEKMHPQDHPPVSGVFSAGTVIDAWAKQALLGDEYAEKLMKVTAASESADRSRPGSGNSTATVNNRVLYQLIPVQAKL